MPNFVTPTDDSLVEVNHCHGPGKGHSCRLSIRPGVHRDKAGFHVRGTDANGMPVRIFTASRGSAEHIKQKKIAGQPVDVADFADRPAAPAKPKKVKVETHADRVAKMTDDELRSHLGAADFNQKRAYAHQGQFSNKYRMHGQQVATASAELQKRARARRRQRSTSSRFL